MQGVQEASNIDRLKAGKTATFIVHETSDKGIGVAVTLSGFKEGFAQQP